MKFDGEKFANQIKKRVQAQIRELVPQMGVRPRIVSFVFLEDKIGQLYTRLKKAAAEEVGIDYRPHLVKFSDYDLIVDEIKKLNQDQSVTGIMIQKPTKDKFKTQNSKLKAKTQNSKPLEFNSWWQGLVSAIEPKKDVDGLSPTTLASIKDGTWRKKGLVPPATAKAVFNIITHFIPDWPEKKIAIIGRSDLIGRPLYWMLRQTQNSLVLLGRKTQNQSSKFQIHQLLSQDEELAMGHSISCRVDEDESASISLLGRKEFQSLVKQGRGLRDFDIVVSATGKPNLINAAMVKQGVVLIDVGEPKGDINPDAYKKASFYTPVPGGVGPVTVVSLMENGVNQLHSISSSTYYHDCKGCSKLPTMA